MSLQVGITSGLGCRVLGFREIRTGHLETCFCATREASSKAQVYHRYMFGVGLGFGV